MSALSPKTSQKIAFFVLWLATLLVVVPVGMVIAVIFKNGWAAVSWEFLTQMPRAGMKQGGILPAIVGTFYLVTGAVCFALPLGLLAAIYLSEYAKDSLMNRIVRLAIINLAGVPSVVFGLFGLALFVGFFRFGASILAGSLTLGVMILPVIITSSREALESVPKSFREVSLSLGATKLQTIRYAVLPHALPGVLTGTILGIGRVIGETMAVMMVTGNSASMPRSLLHPVRTLTATVAAEMGETVQGSEHYFSLFAIGVVLFVMTFVINMTADIFLHRNKK